MSKQRHTKAIHNGCLVISFGECGDAELFNFDDEASAKALYESIKAFNAETHT
jgi:hypothetical protein